MGYSQRGKGKKTRSDLEYSCPSTDDIIQTAGFILFSLFWDNPIAVNAHFSYVHSINSTIWKRVNTYIFAFAITKTGWLI